MTIRMLVAGSLIVSQGLLVWWMVKSGLDPSTNSNADILRVSQYRLAAHLAMAFALYTLFFSNGLSNVVKPHDNSEIKGIGRLRGMTHANKLLVFSTVVMGDFVAGLDAGCVYNSWPKYGGRWMPDNLMTKYPSVGTFFKNLVMVQFMLRNLLPCIISILIGVILGSYFFKNGFIWCNKAQAGLLLLSALAGVLLGAFYNAFANRRFVFFWGWLFLVTTTIVLIFKREVDHSVVGQDKAEDDPEEEDELTLGVVDTYAILGKILCLKPMLLMIAFAATDGMTDLKLIAAGITADKIASRSIFLTPLQIILPWLLSKQTAGPKPLNVFLWAYPYRIVMGLVFAVLVYWTPSFREDNGGWFFGSIYSGVVHGWSTETILA
uniref:Uncharacterized protein n=1 Tax=Ditylenchus dipsaci TaxID=166011 RepID=A0A915E1T2_9BILA